MSSPPSLDGTNLLVQTLSLLSGKEKKKEIRPAFQTAARSTPSYTLRSPHSAATRMTRKPLAASVEINVTHTHHNDK